MIADPTPSLTDITPRAAEQAVEEMAERVAKADAKASGSSRWEKRMEWATELVAYALTGMEPGPARDAALARALPSAVGVPVEVVSGIYIASKAIHGPRWREWRDVGHPIVSTWIDEAEAGRTTDWHDLWGRCISEASQAAVTIVYHETGEELKGARVEVGAALAHGRRVIVVGDVQDSWTKHPNVTQVESLNAAMSYAGALICDYALASGAQAGAAGDRPGAAPAGGLPGVEEIESLLISLEDSQRKLTRCAVACERKEPGWYSAFIDADAEKVAIRQSILKEVARLSAAGTGDAGRDDATPDPAPRPEAPARSTAADGLREAAQAVVASAVRGWPGDSVVPRGLIVDLSAALDAAPLADRGEAGDGWHPDTSTMHALAAKIERLRLTNAARDVLAERRRQVEAEGWTLAHDRTHTKGQLADAAASYALRAHAGQKANVRLPGCWPWDASWWKPFKPRRMLVKAGALILAEIERLDRFTPRQERTP